MITRLVSLGNVIIDIVAEIATLPERGTDVLASAAAIEVSGGFNLIAAASRQGLSVAYAGGLGHGPFGDLARRTLAAEGIALLLPDNEADRKDTGFDVVLNLPLQSGFVSEILAQYSQKFLTLRERDKV